MSRPRSIALAVLVALVGAVAPAALPAAAAPAPTTYVLPGDAVFPEGVAAQDRTGNFFVGSTTDGTIFRGNVDRRRTTVFLPGGRHGLTVAVGMKVDRGRLYVAGGSTGAVFVIDLASRRLLAKFVNGLPADRTFLNDIGIAPNGDAYVTDSFNPQLYRIPVAAVRGGSGGTAPLPVFRDLQGSPIQYVQGQFNLNGIQVTADGRYLLTVQSSTGELFRIRIRDKRIDTVDLGQPTVAGVPGLTGGDGLLLLGRTLFAIHASAFLDKLVLSADFLAATVRCSTTYPSFHTPTTIAKVGDRLLVVNSQFDRLPPNQPDLPFTVSGVAVPNC